MIRALLAAMLLMGAVWDIRTRTIRAEPVLVFGLVVILLSIIREGPQSLPGILAGLIPGAWLFLLSKLSRGGIGSGDALVTGLLGAALGFSQVAGILLLAFAGSAVCVCILLLVGRAGRKTRLPFIPFLAVAYLLTLLWP